MLLDHAGIAPQLGTGSRTHGVQWNGMVRFREDSERWIICGFHLRDSRWMSSWSSVVEPGSEFPLMLLIVLGGVESPRGGLAG
jgi:hypothetical protein